ncbi:PucR family transcriptional regulator [Paenibacillus chitinolyticus]|uniref:PucR family transcriptional regulator n=1 Tax=Paenibacillus chitinolyticus TaxID=79263 RepID=A0A410WTK4_9BACL|nr:PucR family transcriptional regulator [Paenibacillus chitinolyticus]MCY9591898.1 PucR family transcriptional regulator ligand-binding domain-containing protein [Paenibacillus chitinolyticus]MCY9594955.1 PucR family transcriptional regulator ligand-binding domain-containing protein [Paenibacillus chitinolyticus]QAV17826.1 PucR family transcriptional regulator [Paenibacillus chitinolyticus]
MNLKGMTVRELLQLPILKDASLISGEEGLDRVVRYIDIMEVPDIKGWLREGELILTTGYSMRNDPGLVLELMEELRRADAAALAIKPERFMGGIPAEMVELSNRYRIPVIQIPPGIPYIDITHTVMEQILNTQAALLRRSEEVNKTLTGLVLHNKGIQVVADSVAELVQAPIWVIHKHGRVIVSSPADAGDPPAGRTKSWDVSVDKQFAGRLIIGKDQLDELELVCIEHARLVFSLELMRRKIAYDTEQRLQGNFFEELLMGLPLSRQDAENKGRQLGLQKDWCWEVCIVEGEPHLFEEHASLPAALGELTDSESAARKVKSHLLRQGDRLVLLLASPAVPEPSTKQPVAGRTAGWADVLAPLLDSHSQIRTGFGGKAPLWEVYRSYVKAKKAMTIGCRLDKERRTFSYDEIEMFDLLLESSAYVGFDAFTEKKIGKLSKYDRDNGTDLVPTFHAYLAAGGSLIEAANKLYIHRNSVKYRLDRIKDIADIDMEDTSKRLIYYLCTSFYLLKNLE